MAARLRICVVATTPWGVHCFFRRHLAELGRVGDVTLVVNPRNESYVPPLDLPTRVVPVPIRRPIAPLGDLTALVRILWLFTRERFDLVWGTAPKAGLLGMLAARLVGVRVRVFVFQGEVWASRTGFSRWLLKRVDRFTASCATHLLAVSESEKRFLEAEGVVPSGRLQVLGAGSISGVDLDRYRPDPGRRVAIRDGLGIPRDAVVALFVGRLSADKGIGELAEAFRQASARRPELWLLVVGPDDGVAADRVAEMLGEAQGRSRFVGFQPRPEDHMAAADFLCLPSHREGFGLVVVEAGATGIPAIGSRIHGISDAIRDGETGILTEPKNVADLADALGRLADDDALRRQMGDAARAYAVASFSSVEVVGRYLEYFRRLL